MPVFEQKVVCESSPVSPVCDATYVHVCACMYTYHINEYIYAYMCMYWWVCACTCTYVPVSLSYAIKTPLLCTFAWCCCGLVGNMHTYDSVDQCSTPKFVKGILIQLAFALKLLLLWKFTPWNLQEGQIFGGNLNHHQDMHTCSYMQIHSYTCIYRHIHTNTYQCMQYMYIYTHTYIYTHIHAHKYQYMQVRAPTQFTCFIVESIN